MEEIFGELSDEDVAAYFGGKALGSRKWTLAFKFKSMKDMDPTRKVQQRRKKRKRTAEGEALRYLRRRLDMSNHKEKLAKVLGFSSTERKQAADLIMDEIERNEHIMTEKFFAFRKSLEDETQNYQSTSKYYENIQDMLIREVGLTEEEYFYDGPGPFVPGHYFSSLHFDVTEWTRQAPSLSLEDHTIGGAIFDKFKRDLRKFVRSDKYSGAVDIHFHADVNDLMARQRAKRPDLAIDDLALRGCGDVDNCSEPHCENKLFADFNIALQGNWTDFYKDSSNRVFLSMLHPILGAKAMWELLEKENAASQEETTPVRDRQTFIYIHGVSITIIDAARECSLAELQFSRFRDAILVSRANGADKTLLQTPVFLENAQSYPPCCCWMVSRSGIERFGGGDCQHAESQTRIARSILTVTEPRFRQLRIGKSRRNVLVVAKSKGVDGPIIVSGLSELCSVSISYRVKNTTVHVPRLLRALHKIRVSPEHLQLLFAMSGCGTLPSTHKVSPTPYFRALLKHREVIGNLRDEEDGFDLRNYKESTWRSFEKLVATAYVDSMGLSETYLGSRDVLGVDWVHTVRTCVVKQSKTMSPADLMPPSSDIELQTRRVFWLLRYWSMARDFRCDELYGHGLCVEWGFDENGIPILEKEADVMERRNVMKTIVLSCRCKRGCTSSRCGSRKDSRSLLCVLCECENCENRGRVTQEEINALSGCIRTLTHDIGEELDGEEDHDDSESDSDEICSLFEYAEADGAMDIDVPVDDF